MAKVTADFEYRSITETYNSTEYLKDGRWDTQTQTVFWAKPAAGFIFTRIDLGEIYNIQVIDLIAGFFRPEDEPRIRIDFSNTYTLQYSLDNITFYDVCKKSKNFQLSAGEAISFELGDLGDDFKGRFLQIVVEDMSKITWKAGCWVVAFADLAVYSDTILVGEAKLTATEALQTPGADTYTTASNLVDATSLAVNSTLDFCATGTAIAEGNPFTYTSLTATTFEGCVGLTIHSKLAKIIQTPLVYDSANLLQMRDKVYKDTSINEFLSTQKKVNTRAYNWLREVIKDHSKCTAVTLYGPHYRPGMTVRVIDTTNNIDARYFIEAVQVSASNNAHPTILTLAKYP